MRISFRGSTILHGGGKTTVPANTKDTFTPSDCDFMHKSILITFIIRRTLQLLLSHSEPFRILHYIRMIAFSPNPLTAFSYVEIFYPL